eukprot:403364152
MSTNNSDSQKQNNGSGIPQQDSQFQSSSSTQSQPLSSDIASRIMNMSPYDIPVNVPQATSAQQTGSYGSGLPSPYGSTFGMQNTQQQMSGVYGAPNGTGMRQDIPQSHPTAQLMNQNIPIQQVPQQNYIQPTNQGAQIQQFEQPQRHLYDKNLVNPLVMHDIESKGGLPSQVPQFQQNNQPIPIPGQFSQPPQYGGFHAQQPYPGNQGMMPPQPGYYGQQPPQPNYGLQQQALRPRERTSTQRELFINDIILKHPDILTEDEQLNLVKRKEWMSFSLMMGLASIPYSVFLTIQARRHPSRRREYIRRIFVLPFLPAALIYYHGNKQRKQLMEFQQKYFSHLSDQDLDNFESYYVMRMNQQVQQIPPIFPPPQSQMQMYPPQNQYVGQAPYQPTQAPYQPTQMGAQPYYGQIANPQQYQYQQHPQQMMGFQQPHILDGNVSAQTLQALHSKNGNIINELPQDKQNEQNKDL